MKKKLAIFFVLLPSVLMGQNFFEPKPDISNDLENPAIFNNKEKKRNKKKKEKKPVEKKNHFIDVTTTIAPGNNYKLANFRLVVPKKYDECKAILLAIPGYQGNGLAIADRKGWLDFAIENKLAIMTVHMQSDRKRPNYHKMDQDSGRAFFEALSQLTKKAKMPKINDLPLLVTGHSAGGQCAFGMACIAPERIIAFAGSKGGYYLTQEKSLEQTAKVPGILYIGEKDLERRIKGINDVYTKFRKENAIWTLAIDPGAGHGPGKTPELTKKFFKIMLELRLSKEKKGKLVDISEMESWQGDLETKTISAKPKKIKKTKKKKKSRKKKKTEKDKKTEKLSVWLPNEEFAKEWKEFIETGK